MLADSRRQRRWTVALCAALLLGLTFVLYGRSLDEFLYKDDFVLLLRSKNEGLMDLVVRRTLAHLRGEGETAYWRPGWWLVLKLDYALFGLHLWAHRALCLALHAVLVLAVQWVATRRSGSVVAGLLAGLLFAANPGFVEAVVWMAAATNVLPAAALILAAGLAWLAFLESGSARACVAALLGLAFSLLFREAAYHLPLLFALGWLCVRGWPRSARAARSLGIVLGLSLVLIIAHYAWLTAREGPALASLGQRLLEGASGFAAACAPLGIEPRLVLGLGVALLLGLFWCGSPAARYFLAWGVVASFPYVALGYGSRFAYFAGMVLPIGLVLGARDLTGRLGRAAGSVALALGGVAVLGQVLVFGRTLEPYLEKGRTCERVLEFCRAENVARFEHLGAGLLPRVLSPGFDAMLELYLGKKIAVVDARIVPRPPCAVYLHPLPPEEPGTAFLAFDGGRPRLCARAELFGGLVPLPLVSFRTRWRVVPEREQALRQIRADAADLEHEVLLPEAPQLAYEDAAEESRLERMEYTADGLVLEVSCPANTILVLAVERREEPRVTVDGKPARPIRADGRFEALELPAGTRRIVWKGAVDV